MLGDSSRIKAKVFELKNDCIEEEVLTVPTVLASVGPGSFASTSKSTTASKQK